MCTIYKIIFSFALFVLLPFSTHAASLHFSPSLGSHDIGTTFSINISVESNDQAMNAASGLVSFPLDKLEVVSISKVGSIFSLWTTEPNFSNTRGTISFEGIVLNPGYQGASGKILSVTFRVKSAGVANIFFSSSSVLANDGTGTNILENVHTGVYTLTNTVILPIETPSEVPIPAQNIPKSEISLRSATHPDQTKWYSNNTPEFSWNLPEGALEVKTLIGKSPEGTPAISYPSPISNKKVDELPDGTYYFSLQVRTASGWSDISRYKVNIDTTAPEPFDVIFPEGFSGWNPRPIASFNTKDETSGVNRYEVRVGSENPVKVDYSATSNLYSISPQYPGTYTLLVTAFDEAGNTRTSTGDFTIEAIDTPIITSYQEEIESGDIMKIRGTTYPNSDVVITIKNKDEIYTQENTKSNNIGDFAIIISKNLTPGVYEFTVRVTDSRGARSNETSPLSIIVNSNFLVGIITTVLNYLSAVVILLVAIFAIVGGGIYMWYRSAAIIRRLKKQNTEAERITEKSFTILRKDIDSHISKLKKAKVKRKLTAEEVSFLKKFNSELSEAEEAIKKEIKG